MALAIHDERLTRRVGAVVLVLAALTVAFVVVVYDRLERAGVDVRIRFGEATGIGEGAPVRVAGRTIGHVRAISIARHSEGTGIVVEIRLDPAWAARIPVNSDFFVDARSPLAPRYVAIGPPPGHANPARAVVDGDEVFGVDPPNMDRVLQRTWNNLTEVRAFMDALRPATARLDAATDRIAATVRGLAPRAGAWAELDLRVAAAIEEARAVFADVRAGTLDPAAIARLAEHVDACASRVGVAIADARLRVAEVRAALMLATSHGDRASLELRARLDHTLAAADRALATAGSLADQLGGLVHDATAGHGSVAAFAADLELVDDVKTLTKQMKRAPWRVAAPPAP